jgi:hypothetical protein
MERNEDRHDNSAAQNSALSAGESESAKFVETADAGSEELSPIKEMAAMREEAAPADDAITADAHDAEASPADLAFAETDASTPSMASESMSPSSSLGPDARGEATSPTLSYLGPIQRLDDLPQDVIASLDDESAANLLAAIRNPEKFEPGYLDHTSIRELYARAAPMDEPGDPQAPWYHTPLPPVRLEVTLLSYDWMVDKAIDRAAGRIDRATDQKIDGKINSAKFELRGEIRRLLR